MKTEKIGRPLLQGAGGVIFVCFNLVVIGISVGFPGAASNVWPLGIIGAITNWFYWMLLGDAHPCQRNRTNCAKHYPQA